MSESDPAHDQVHDEIGTDAEVEEAAARQRQLTGAILNDSGADTVEDLVRPEDGE